MVLDGDVYFYLIPYYFYEDITFSEIEKMQYVRSFYKLLNATNIAKYQELLKAKKVIKNHNPSKVVFRGDSQIKIQNAFNDIPEYILNYEEIFEAINDPLFRLYEVSENTQQYLHERWSDDIDSLKLDVPSDKFAFLFNPPQGIDGNRCQDINILGYLIDGTTIFILTENKGELRTFKLIESESVNEAIDDIAEAGVRYVCKLLETINSFEYIKEGLNCQEYREAVISGNKNRAVKIPPPIYRTKLIRLKTFKSNDEENVTASPRKKINREFSFMVSAMKRHRIKVGDMPIPIEIFESLKKDPRRVIILGEEIPINCNIEMLEELKRRGIEPRKDRWISLLEFDVKEHVRYKDLPFRQTVKVI